MHKLTHERSRYGVLLRAGQREVGRGEDKG